ncbi:hypothetical protein [uncultured Corynebacterium sp.]|uniref:hypothetical protein n=1 Tax=uncultured Corynebacterium sp. TaxID=159447 RepID=UPI0025DE8B4D|nr:hypothetical protein [uncultured Corynebacterium sp.]
MKRIVAAGASLALMALAAPSALAAPAVATATAADATQTIAASSAETSPEASSAAITTGEITPVPVLVDGEFDADDDVQVSYVHLPTGFRVDSDNGDQIRPCLSICKIFIADHVFRHGTAADKKLAVEMLKTSDDDITTGLYRRYPKSTNEVAERYGLDDTTGASRWGKSKTTMHDVTTFLAAKVKAQAASGTKDPVLAALADPALIAADGYVQNYGTDVLPGVIGTKWGWSDKNAAMHATASYGDDFVVALNVLGDPDDATDAARDLFTPAASDGISVDDGELDFLEPRPSTDAQIRAAAAGPDSGTLIAGALLLITAAGIVWVLRGRGK